MRNKIGLIIGLISIGAAIAFSIQSFHAHHQVHHLRIVTGSREGEYYKFATVMAKVVKQHYPKLQLEVAVSQGSVDNLLQLNQRKADLAIVQSDALPRPSVQAIAFLFPEVFHLLARPEANIQTIMDLAGKRVALMPQGSGSYDLYQTLNQHYRLDQSDVKTIPMKPEAAYTALRQGKVDALFRVIALGNEGLRSLLKETRSKIIPIDQVDAIRLVNPILEAVTIPQGTYDGLAPIPAKDVAVAGVRAVLVAHENTDVELVRAIAETLVEHRSEIIVDYPQAALLPQPDEALNPGIPLHLGARAYYDKERPNFLVANSDAIGVSLSLGTLLASGIWQLRSQLSAKQKDRADKYNLQLVQLIEQMPHIESLEELQAVRQQLFDILRTVIVDLDVDRISPESFQSFTFPWETAITALRHRETILLRRDRR
jgi:uncharacterized protein